MKKIEMILAGALVLAFAASCDKEFGDTPKTGASVIKVVANAGTKTYIDDNNFIKWSASEQMVIGIAKDSATTAFIASDVNTSAEGNDTTSFTFQYEPGELEAPYTIYGVYPRAAAVTIKDSVAKSFRVNLPSVQYATNTSYDPATMILFAKTQEVESFDNPIQMSFRRTVALNKLTLTGIADPVNKVRIVTPKVIAGKRYFNLQTEKLGNIYNEQSKQIEVVYGTPNSDQNKNVWFASWGAEFKQNDTLTIIAFTDDARYVRKIAVNESGIKFKEDCLCTLSVDMSQADKRNLLNVTLDFTKADTYQTSEGHDFSTAEKNTVKELTFGKYTFVFHGTGTDKDNGGFYRSGTTEGAYYLTIGKAESYIQTPAIQGRQLKKVIVTAGNTQRPNMEVRDTLGSAVSPAQLWGGTKNAQYTFDIASPTDKTPYRIVVKNSAIAPIKKLELKYL